ncbi:MAG: hypothetical protein HQK99_16720 [Nitrospirae bacterium]|nr:hypothetical protein [Nitrospirota bacterium]
MSISPPDNNNCIDNPRKRLPWTILISLIIWGVVMWGFGALLETALPQRYLPPPVTIHAQLIQLQKAEPVKINVPAEPKTVTESKPPAVIQKSEPKPSKQQQMKQVLPEQSPHSDDNATAQQNDNVTTQQDDNSSGIIFMDLGYPR